MGSSVVVNTVKVSLGAGSAVVGAVTQSGTWTVTLPALPAGGNVIGAVKRSSGTTVTSSSFTATTTATAVFGADSTRLSVAILNLGTGDVWVGGATVSANNGLRISAGQTAIIDKAAAATLYVICTSGTQGCAYFAEYA